MMIGTETDPPESSESSPSETAAHGMERHYVIPSERMPEALSGLEAINGFLAEIETLDIGNTAPAMVFEPSWDES